MVAKATSRTLACLLATSALLATPLAGAFSMGVDAGGAADMRSSGVSPVYAQTWVGSWMRSSGWGGFESDLRTARDAGATPMVMWYYWGDGISQSCVKYGCNGNSKGDWDWMAGELARRAHDIMGGKRFLVVLEPEFNKKDIPGWDTFDGFLADQARIVRAAAPEADIVVGFGYWGGWEAFDRAAAASDLVGFQLMRASTRDSSSTALGATQQIIDTAKALRSKFGKDVVVFDLAIGSYGGWEWVQERVFKDLQARRTEVDAAGVRVIVWRYVKDNDHSSGYFGAAESSWGVRYAWGGKKSSYDDLVALMGGSTTVAPAPAPAPATGTTVFTGVLGNEWWIQASAEGSPTRVEARLAGGIWQTLAKQSWGAWARSFHLPTGSTVELRATYADGSAKTASTAWPPPSPTLGGSSSASAPTPTGAYAPTWSCVSAKNWWTQACVTGGPSSVDVRVDGGAWQVLAKQSWGGWAKSFALPAGSKVEFRATAGGATAYSQAYWSR